mgnify:FL=1
MKKKYLTTMAMAICMTATISLQAQDSPNGIGTGTDTPVLDQQSWNLVGNILSGTSNKLGSTNAYLVRICTNNTERIFIDTTGKVGINTTLPLQKLHVLDGNILISRSTPRELGSTNGTIYFGDVVDASEPYGKWGIEYVSSQQEGYGLNFWKPWVTGQNGGNFYLFLADSGNVGIGTNNPQAKLAVNGGILAREIRVSVASSDWPDYVFDENYELMSLKDLDAYVKANKHLPGVPSASELEEQGDVDLGEMNAVLLGKVEELTRYVIDLQKQIDEMKK